MAPSLLLLLVILSSSCSSSSCSSWTSTPRRSFLLNSSDRPVFLLPLDDVTNASTLLLSADGATLYVGAQDALLSLDVSQSDVITLKKKVSWRPSDSDLTQCSFKVKNPSVECQNFVSVLQHLNSSHLYACGSFAFSPKDVFIDKETFSSVRVPDEKAKFRCPHSPLQRSSALTYGGELFTATPTNFRGKEPQVSRHFSKHDRQDVSQDPSANLLQEPTFVSSSLDPTDGKLYFFFSEVGQEFHFTEELKISRVAQVCKDDVGGVRTLQKRWTSFAKAALLCQAPKQLLFNLIQDVFTLQPPEGSNSSETLFIAVFTSQWSSGPDSAVCVFNLQDVRDVFRGGFMTLRDGDSGWSLRPGGSFLGRCGLESALDSDLGEVKKSFLTSGKVSPVGHAPVLVSSQQRYSRVAAMRAKAVNRKQYVVVFLLTDSGFLHRGVMANGGVRLIEEVQVFTAPQLVTSLVLSPAKGALYVGTSGGVASVPVTRCSVHRSCSQCVLSRDPLCGWSRSRAACSALRDAPHDQLDDMAQDVDHANVSDQCGGQTRVVRVKEVLVQLNEAVQLPCQKPSNPSSLTWTRSGKLPDGLFVRSSDGALRFLAARRTVGTYVCTAEEGGHKEVVARFSVRLTAPPRSVKPPPKDDGEDQTTRVLSEEPETTATQPGNDHNDPESPMIQGDAQTVTDLTDPTDDQSESFTDDSSALTSTRAPPPRKTPHVSVEKSYYGELVAVSLLLAFCVCALMLAALHTWRRSRAEKVNPLIREDVSRTDQSLESVPSLSSPEDSGPDLTQVQ